MAEPTREQVAQVEAQFNAHPAVQAFLANPSKGVMGWMRVVSQVARETGIQMPHDYQPAVRGGRVALEKKSFIERNGWFLPALAVGAPIAAGAAMGVFGAAAPGALPATVTPQAMSTLPAASAAPAASGLLPATVFPQALSTLPAAGEVGRRLVTDAASEGGRRAANAARGAGPAAANSLRDVLTRAGVTAGLTGLGQAFGAGQPEIPQELRDILALQKQRMEAQSPLYASILQLAQSRLPTSVQGAQLPGSGASLPQQQAVEQLARRR